MFFHKNKQFREFEFDNLCKSWKQKVNESYDGGFDSRKHPIFIEEAIKNAELSFKPDVIGGPTKGATEVYLLAKSIFNVIKNKITKVSEQIIVSFCKDI